MVIGVGEALLMMLLLLTTTRFSKYIQTLYFLTRHLSVAFSMMMKVISTDGEASLPATDGRAEILNSSLVQYPEVTLCARFLTHHFSTHPDGEPTQTLISYGYNNLLSSLVARPCDQYYQADRLLHPEILIL